MTMCFHEKGKAKTVMDVSIKKEVLIVDKGGVRAVGKEG